MSVAEDAVRRFLAGNEEAFETIVRQSEKRIYNLALRFLGNREDAQDVVQETFLSAYRSLPALRDPKSFSTWLYRIALNHCRARWRSSPEEVGLEESFAAGDPSPELPGQAEPAANARDPLETVDLIRKALMNLSAEHRMAIVLKEYMGLSLEELAAVMNCPLSTAKSRLYHGLREVQRDLKRLKLR